MIDAQSIVLVGIIGTAAYVSIREIRKDNATNWMEDHRQTVNNMLTPYGYRLKSWKEDPDDTLNSEMRWGFLPTFRDQAYPLFSVNALQMKSIIQKYILTKVNIQLGNITKRDLQMAKHETIWRGKSHPQEGGVL